MPTLAAYTYRTAMGLPIVYPKKKFGYMKNFLYMMFSNPMHDDFVIDNKIIKAMEAIFIIHADHEQNASTSTVRIAGSSMANPFACVAAGIGSLWGPRHGGANEAVLNML
jgi:citrate synthase